MLQPNLLDLREELLVNSYLEHQQRLTSIDRFSKAYDAGTVVSSDKIYSDLIPLQAPESGQQYAFEVDLDLCTGCKACVTGCHSRNGLEPDETWRQVGVIQGTDEQQPFMQTVTSACHHCLTPECMSGCPTMAYDKDPVTGIVHHLDDQCIGCQYCVLKCPYGVPQYSKAKGIVRKCDMCADRLEAGEAPACVQSCPNEAIRVTVVDQTRARRQVRGRFGAIRSAPDPRRTLPTTIYKTTRQFPDEVQAQDAHVLRVEDPHYPLVVMLVLTQVGFGILAIQSLVGPVFGKAPEMLHPFVSLTAAVLISLGMAAAPLHLGRPLGAFRAVLGLRTSWISRELLTLSLFFAAVMLLCALDWFPTALSQTGLVFSRDAYSGIVVLTGAAGIFSSAMIYIDTPRDYWAHPRTGLKFMFSGLLGGAAALLAVDTIFSAQLGLELHPGSWGFYQGVAAATAVLAGVKLILEYYFFPASALKQRPHLQGTVSLQMTRFRNLTTARIVLLLGAGIGLPIYCGFYGESQAGWSLVGYSLLGFLLVTAGELIERFLFFTTSIAPGMPGMRN